MMDDDVELCTWVDFSLTDIERFLTFCCDREGLKQELRQKLTPRSVENEKQDLIELDMYIYAFLFGVKQEFSSAQLSTLLGIVKRLHAKCISTVFDNQGHVLQFFQQMMVQHSVRRPPFSLCVFSPNEVKKINEYILSTYFKHYKLYKYAFTKKVRLNLGLSYAGQVEPEEAVDEEITSHENEENTVDRESHEDVGEEELEAEPASSHLKELINSGLSKLVQQEQDQLQAQLAAQETRLLGRITVLEAAVDTKRPNTNASSAKKKSSNKSGH